MNRRPRGREADDPTVVFSSEKMLRGTFVVPSLLCRACAVDDARKTTTLVLVAACGGRMAREVHAHKPTVHSLATGPAALFTCSLTSAQACVVSEESSLVLFGSDLRLLGPDSCSVSTSLCFCCLFLHHLFCLSLFSAVEQCRAGRLKMMPSFPSL